MSPGSIIAVDAAGDNIVDNGNMSFLVAEIFSPFGIRTDGPVNSYIS